ncbi:TetR family transcriptional regulator C-terminal domain-containing protein [Streptomyces sp. NPDC101227]|uniref:TetR family transcriptional regulator C-terminal domain-containing protein n=1 Tax=Streptomyces sp. NPDC101227 TaxID=3366136 RepID=UPI00380A6621
MRDEKRDDEGRACRVCGASLPAAERGRPPAYCSRSCQAKAYRQRHKERAGGATAGPDAEAAPPPGAGTAGDRRRREIAEAVWRIAAGRGLESASMREVAAEAGVSLRVVQYTFGSKQRLLVEALRLLHEENDRRARARVERLPDPADPRAVLRTVLGEFLPLDGQRRMALRVFLAYYVRSLTDPALAEVFLHGGRPLEELVAALIRQAGARPGAAVHPGLDPEREADLLVSGVTGLGMDVLHGRRTLADVRRTVDYHLDRTLGPA